MGKSRIFIFVFCMSLCGPVVSSQQASPFDAATEAYNKGDYQGAIDAYEQILDQDKHSAALYFNLGNAHYKLGHIAPSVYYYEKALLLRPEDPEIRNNLAFANNMTLDAIQPLPRSDIGRMYDSLLYTFSIDGWAYLGIFFMILFSAGYLTFYMLWKPNQKRLALVVSLASLFLALSSTVLSYLQYRAYLADQPAVIFAEEVVVRSEPNERSQQAFTLHEGTKVQLLDSLEGWNKIELTDGQVGWMPAENLKALKDF